MSQHFVHALAAATKRCDHVFVDPYASRATAGLLLQCERIWWLIEQNKPAEEAFTAHAEAILAQQSELRTACRPSGFSLNPIIWRTIPCTPSHAP
ncbi:MAG: hypothetical protein H6939_05710 [Burkholderiales bacterium]|nr:hypothetical protein [Burkholderiales bacterium]